MLRRDVAAIAFVFAGILVVADWLRAAHWLVTVESARAGGIWAAVLSLVSLGFGIGVIVRATCLADWLFPGAGAENVEMAAAEAWFEVGLGLLGIYLLVVHLPILLGLGALWVQLSDGPISSASSIPQPTPTFDPLRASMRQGMVTAAAGVGIGTILLLTRNSLAQALAQPRWQLSQRATIWVWLAVSALVAFRLLAGYR